MTLKEKYFAKEGEVAFQLWICALALQELKVQNNKAKAIQVRERIIEFSESAWVYARASSEEKADIKLLIDELTLLTIE